MSEDALRAAMERRTKSGWAFGFRQREARIDVERERAELYRMLMHVQQLQEGEGGRASAHLLGMVLEHLKATGPIECPVCFDDVSTSSLPPRSHKFNHSHVLLCTECSSPLCGKCASMIDPLKCPNCRTPMDGRLVYESNPREEATHALAMAMRNGEREDRAAALKKLLDATPCTNFTALCETTDVPELNTPDGYALFVELVGDANTTPESDRPRNQTLYEAAMQRLSRMREQQQAQQARKRAAPVQETSPHMENLLQFCIPSRWPGKCPRANAALDTVQKNGSRAHKWEKGALIGKIGDKYVCTACITEKEAEEAARRKRAKY